VEDRRCLLVGGVARIKGRLRSGGKALLAARNSLEGSLRENEFLKSAPFKTVSLIIRCGDRDDLNPDFGVIDKRTLELPIAIELDLKRLQMLTDGQIVEEFRLAMIEVLCDVAANFDLPYEFLDKFRSASAAHDSKKI
jgi:hypothetical protein